MQFSEYQNEQWLFFELSVAWSRGGKVSLVSHIYIHDTLYPAYALGQSTLWAMGWARKLCNYYFFNFLVMSWNSRQVMYCYRATLFALFLLNVLFVSSFTQYLLSEIHREDLVSTCLGHTQNQYVSNQDVKFGWHSSFSSGMGWILKNDSFGVLRVSNLGLNFRPA